ncbi:MAG: hypothetical protein KGR26_05610, partial [Cyanobacteria bacterium REEB65]|nr:hypothetical protein [Cyanobacteria bacterium REEB65]
VTNAIAGASTPYYTSLAQQVFSIASGVAQSLGYDTGTTQPTFVSANPTESLNGGTITFQYSSSPDNSSWSAWTPNLAAVPAQRYLRWQATLTGNAVLTGMQIVFDY